MNAKSLVRVLLLLFVAASVITIFQKELRPAQESQDQQVQTVEVATQQNDKTMVYYFHGATRCKTCRSIEALTIEALETEFPEQIAEGSLVIKSVNLDEAANQHFVQDFELSVRSVVLERIADGQHKEWKSLNSVWDRIHGEPQDFMQFIQDQAHQFLDTQQS